MDPIPPSSPDPSSSGRHLATISHQGRFWDVYLEFGDEPRSPDTFRARLCFSPADRNEHEEPLRTTTLIIEPSYEEALARAERLEEHHLVALLRSVIPDQDES